MLRPAAATPTRHHPPARWPTLVAAGWLVAPGSPAWACADCAAGIRAQVRRGIWDAGFGPNLLAMVLPFAVFLGAAVLVHAGRPGPDRPERPR